MPVQIISQSSSPCSSDTSPGIKMVNGQNNIDGAAGNGHGPDHRASATNGRKENYDLAADHTRKDYEDWLRDSERDEDEVPDLCLRYTDPDHQGETLARLNTLRKGGQFCDVFLEVDGREVAAHRAVLACGSVYLFELFSIDESSCPAHFQLEGFDYDSFRILVDYAYTSKLEVPEEKVKSVYKTAMMLKMGSVAEACSRYLAKHLTPNNCLGTRAFANSHSDMDLTMQTDDFIQSNMEGVATSPELKSLPCVQLNILGVDDTDLDSDNTKHLCNLVIDWMFTNLHDQTLTEVCEDLKVLYLTSDNTLRDCHDVDDELFTASNIVQDYKRKEKIKKKNIVMKPERHKTQQPGWEKKGSGMHLPMENQPSTDMEWKLVSMQLVGDKGCLCLAFLGDRLARLSLNFLPLPTPSQSGGSSPQGSPPTSQSPHGSMILCEKQCSLTPLARMGTARCGVGTANLDGQLLALGGYDRGECLSTVEAFDITKNMWTPMMPMLVPRGRFDVTQIDGKLFACGGSNGSAELHTAEYYDPAIGKWEALPDMRKTRSSAGVATLSGKVYVIGGWSGQSGLADCEVFDPSRANPTWKAIARLNTGRSQAGVCGINGRLIVAGGCDAWNCINTVEEYDPVTNRWRYVTSMASCRRGAGVAVFKGKLYVVGGSDGTTALATVEVYDPETQSWSIGSTMSVPRANVGVVVINNRLFAVGGFSGKAFLETIEYLNEAGQEWCSFLPVEGR